MCMRLDFVDSGTLFRFRPWGMWIQGEEDMPLEVFNSATVYLKRDEEGREGK